MADAEANIQPQPLWHGLAAGSVSAVGSRLLTYPTDTIKARLQVQGAVSTATNTNTLQAISRLAATEGIVGFYRGFGAVLAGIVPATTLYFGSYELSKRVIGPNYGLLGDLAVGTFAQLAAGVAFTPVDIIKERMQTQSMMRHMYTYSSAVQAWKALLSAGRSGGVLKGYWITNSVWIPWNMLYTAAYEASKRGTVDALDVPKGEALPAWSIAGCSAGSASFASLFTHPLDVVKTRLQVLSAGGDGAKLRAADIAKAMMRDEGIRSFSSGLTARMLTLAPATALSWAMYESVKSWLRSA